MTPHDRADPIRTGGGGEVLFETERLVLRTFRREDLERAAAINADGGRYLGGR